MTTSSNRPRVFVRSTIRDFSDLRSALKFWLEEMGYEVRMSEFTDFERRPEQDTFESCFEAIKDCDYYILLVGGCKGSDYTDGVSVTQQEYRVATELAQQGRIKPIIFIRDNVMTAIDERRTLDVAEGISASLPSRVLLDPDFVRSFVDEIKRTQLHRLDPESAAGSIWYYRFGNFRDIVDALRVNLRIYRSVQAETLLSNLKWELEENVAALCPKSSRKDMPMPEFTWLSHVRTTLRLTTARDDAPRRLNAQQLERAALFCLFGVPAVDHLQVEALTDAIASGEFLVYDRELGRPVSGDIQDAMYALRAAIDRCRSVRQAIRENDLEYLTIMQANREHRSTHDLRVLTLAHLYRLHDEMENVVRLSFALLRYILDPSAGFHMPTLNPQTPFDDQVEAIRAERASHEEVEAWAKDNFMARWLTKEPWASVEDVAAGLERYPSLREAVDRVTQSMAEFLRQHEAEITQAIQADGEAGLQAWLDRAEEYGRWETLRREDE